ncbi:MAG: transposase [bacterium]|nr:transposase [bacterium]
MRKEKFVTGEYYHVFNRGVDKRDIFMDEADVLRFFQGMNDFNTTEPIGSIYEKTFYKDSLSDNKDGKLVNFIAYCLNPNHYHFLLEQLVDNGISLLMAKIGGGYASYFNEKNKRVGSLFQGRFKAKHISSNDYLLHVSTYVNLNNLVHGLGPPNLENRIKSSWEEYRTKERAFCEKDIILGQFKTTKEYEIFAKEALELMIEKKKNDKEISSLMFD